MPTLQRALKVKNGMGIAYYIYWDNKYDCFRVMDKWSPSLMEYGRYNLIQVS